MEAKLSEAPRHAPGDVSWGIDARRGVRDYDWTGSKKFSHGGSMGKKTVLFLIVALMALAVLPAVASADLVNEYGMHFAGKAKCIECHSSAFDATVHGRMARTGL